MRVRLQTLPPLPPLKAWFVVPTLLVSNSAQATVLDLKQNLNSEVAVLDDLHSNELVLELDGFELLDNTVLDVVKEGDLLLIRRRINPTYSSEQRTSTTTMMSQQFSSIQRSTLPSKKRKREAPDATPNKVHSLTSSTSFGPHIVKKLAPLDSNSDSTSSSSGSPSASSTSSSEDDDSSEESSSSDSSSSSSPSVQLSTKLAIKNRPDVGIRIAKATILKDRDVSRQTPIVPPLQKPLPPQHRSSPPTVPPGQGSLQTQKRNDRRRVLRRAKAEAKRLKLVPANTTMATTTPLGTGTDSTILHQNETTQPDSNASLSLSTAVYHSPIASLKNTNKKRDFQKAMQNTPTKKVVFPYSGDDASIPQPRLIPPSERTDLPANVFVTQVNCEDLDARTSGKGKGKSKTTNNTINDQEYHGDEFNIGAIADLMGTSLTTKDEIWRAVDQMWSTLAPVMEPVPVGTLVAWEALGINSQTLTPEMLKHVGRVISWSPNEGITIKQLVRPGNDQLGFGIRSGGPMVVDGDSDRPVGIEGEDGEDILVSVHEMSTWKVVSLA